MIEKDKKIILYIGGGAMAGIFGAGVMAALLREDYCNKIKTVYASSAGVLVAAYFLAGQPEGASIFYDDLIRNFITPAYIPLGIYDRFVNRFIKRLPPDKIRNPIDIDYAFRIITEFKKLNISSIKERGIPFFVHVLNTKTMKSEFINLLDSKDPVTLLKASVATVPYYFPSDGGQYIDGEIENQFPVSEISRLWPNQPILAVLNIIPHRTVRHFLMGLIEGAVASLMYPMKIWNVYLSRDRLIKNEFKIAASNKNVFIIAPPKELKLWPNTLSRDKLLVAYKTGQEAGKDFLAGHSYS